jgi:tetratricopeptide (TPR) repeat protein
VRVSGNVAAIAAWTVFSWGNAPSQTLDRPLPLKPECVKSIQKAMTEVAVGQLAEAGEELSTALSRVENSAGDPCAGLILHNLATIASISGRFGEAERLAARSIAALEKIYPAGDRALWRPLMLLAGARLEQGNKSGARADLKRLREIRPEQPQDRALIHGTLGSLLQHAGEHREAELEYLAALEAWKDSERGETVDEAAVLMSFATLLIEDRRLEEARHLVDRAAAILLQSKDATPMDHSKLLLVRGAVHAGRREWPNAEIDFREALAIADGQPAVDAAYILTLLTSFTEALNNNHHRQEGRRMEARAAALRVASPTLDTVVDVSDLRAYPRPQKK